MARTEKPTEFANKDAIHAYVLEEEQTDGSHCFNVILVETWKDGQEICIGAYDEEGANEMVNTLIENSCDVTRLPD